MGGRSALTPREISILDLLARGFDNARIAAHLDLSEKTIRNRVAPLLDKLAVENRAQAIVRAREAGYGMLKIPPGPPGSAPRNLLDFDVADAMRDEAASARRVNRAKR